MNISETIILPVTMTDAQAKFFRLSIEMIPVLEMDPYLP